MQVVEKDGKYWCEHDNKAYDSMQRRYVMNMQVTDFTGQQHVNVFNDQAERILGHSADVIGVYKEVCISHLFINTVFIGFFRKS